MKNDKKELYTKTVGVVKVGYTNIDGGTANSRIGIKMTADRVSETLTLTHENISISVPYREVEKLVKEIRK